MARPGGGGSGYPRRADAGAWPMRALLNATSTCSRIQDHSQSTLPRQTAQYEHSVAVTEDGVEIFTLSPTGQDKPEITGGA